jgi:hypothetical protein
MTDLPTSAQMRATQAVMSAVARATGLDMTVHAASPGYARGAGARLGGRLVIADTGL